MAAPGFTAATVPDTNLVPDTAAALRTFKENTADSLVKAVMRDPDRKLFSGSGANKAYLFDEYLENLIITLNDANLAYGEMLKQTYDAAIVYSPTVNSKLYTVLYKTTEGSAKDWIKDGGNNNGQQDGRKAFLVLLYKCKPVNLQSLSSTKTLIKGISINGKKSPEVLIKMLIS